MKNKKIQVITIISLYICFSSSQLNAHMNKGNHSTASSISTHVQTCKTAGAFANIHACSIACLQYCREKNHPLGSCWPYGSTGCYTCQCGKTTMEPLIIQGPLLSDS